MPDRKELKMTKSGNKVKIIVPKFECHTALVLEY